jgi:hypothetical protein
LENEIDAYDLLKELNSPILKKRSIDELPELLNNAGPGWVVKTLKGERKMLAVCQLVLSFGNRLLKKLNGKTNKMF